MADAGENSVSTFTAGERWLLGTVLVVYLPLVFTGLGSDGDADAVVDAGRKWFATGEYAYSRPPAFPVHEALTAVLYGVGGSIATNLGSLLAGLALLATTLRLCRSQGLANGVLVGCGIAVTPAFIIASTSTMDYTLSASLVYGGVLTWMSGRSVLGGVLLGLGVGARLSAAVVLAAFVASALLSVPTRRRDAIAAAGVAGFVILLVYLPAFVVSGYSWGFMMYLVPDWWGGWGAVARFVYKNIYFVGLQTVIAALWGAAIIWRRRRGFPHREWLVRYSLLCILGVEALFWKLPIEVSYLLPALPAAWILAGRAFGGRAVLLRALILVAASYNVVSINIARPDVPHAAQTARLGIWVEPGALVVDIRERLHREALRAGLTR